MKVYTHVSINHTHAHKRPSGHAGDRSHVRDVYSCTLSRCESAGASVGWFSLPFEAKFEHPASLRCPVRRCNKLSTNSELCKAITVSFCLLKSACQGVFFSWFVRSVGSVVTTV